MPGCLKQGLPWQNKLDSVTFISFQTTLDYNPSLTNKQSDTTHEHGGDKPHLHILWCTQAPAHSLKHQPGATSCPELQETLPHIKNVGKQKKNLKMTRFVRCRINFQQSAQNKM